MAACASPHVGVPAMASTDMQRSNGLKYMRIAPNSCVPLAHMLLWGSAVALLAHCAAVAAAVAAESPPPPSHAPA